MNGRLLIKKDRAYILSNLYPEIENTNQLAEQFLYLFNPTPDNIHALTKLAKFYEAVRTQNLHPVARTVQNHFQTILNYLDNRSILQQNHSI